MTRKDSEKEAERPHYYSQFWLDVAAGRKVIGGGLKTDEAETDTELDTVEPEPEPEPISRSGRSTSSVASTHEETPYAAPMAEVEPEPELAVEEFPELKPEFAVDEEEFDQDQELPNILVDEEEVPDMDLVDEDEEDFFDEEEEEEEEEEDDEGWVRGRKKPKPGRQTKLPPKPPAKKQRRDRRY